VEQGLLAADPSVFLVGRNAPKGARLDKGRIKAWSQSDAQSFLESVRGDDLETLWQVYLGTGFRRGEALGLEWVDFDPTQATLTVRRTLSNVGNQPRFQEPKTLSARRTIAIGTSLAQGLVEHRKHQAADRLASSVWDSEHDLVFTGQNGQLLRPEMVTRRLRRLVDEAGLDWVGVHGLRHTMASLALQNGTDIATVSERLGHANTQITALIYLHGSADTDRQAADGLDIALNGTTP